MNSNLIEEIVRALPKGSNLKLKINYVSFISANYSDIPADWYWQLCPPDTNQILKKIGFLKWIPVGEFDDDDDFIIIYPKFHDELLPLFKEALRNLDREDIPILKMSDTPAHQSFLQRIVSTRPRRYRGVI